MPILPRVIIKTFFERGDIPTEAQFASFIDSAFNLFDDKKFLGLKVYNNTILYSIGDTTIHNGLIYEAIAPTIGAFDSTKWQKLTFGALNYAGTWNALTNINPATNLAPHLQSGIGNKGDYYLVIVAGTTNLDGENDWQPRDWAVFDGAKWQKVDNSDLDIQTAAQVSFDNVPSGMNATEVQAAIDELQLRIDTAETDIDTLEISKEPANANIQLHIASTTNPHGVTQTQVGLGNVDNTSDINKPVSTAQAVADALILSTAETFAADPLNINQDSDHRFATDAQIAIWDAKQNALGYVPVPNTTTVNGHELSSNVTVTKSDVGLANVTNFDTTNPSNITQDSAHRFATDVQIAIWDAKQNALGYVPVPNTTTVNGHELSSNVTVTKSDVELGNVTNDQQLSLKFYNADESASGIQNGTSVFTTALSLTFTPADDADYLLEWYYEISTDTNNGNNGGVQGRTLLDGSTIGLFMDFMHFTNTVSPPNPPTVIKPVSVSGFLKMSNLYGAQHIFKIEFSKTSGSGTATVTHPRLVVTKV